jgi:uncharacterized DUF497 family protein
MKIVWDEIKRQQNLAKHGLDFADLEIEFFLGARIETASFGRLMAINRFERVMLSVVFKPLGSEAFSIVSMRVASRKERRI